MFQNIACLNSNKSWKVCLKEFPFNSALFQYIQLEERNQSIETVTVHYAELKQRKSIACSIRISGSGHCIYNIHFSISYVIRHCKKVHINRLLACLPVAIIYVASQNFNYLWMVQYKLVLYISLLSSLCKSWLVAGVNQFQMYSIIHCVGHINYINN